MSGRAQAHRQTQVLRLILRLSTSPIYRVTGSVLQSPRLQKSLMHDVLEAAGLLGCILHAEYEVLKTIGRGTYGKVLLARRKADDEVLVIKQVDLRGLELHEKNSALNEVALLANFDHINIIRYHTCFTESDMLHIVMEHATQGDLASLIQRNADLNKPFTETDIMTW